MYSYEMKYHHTPQGLLYEAKLEMKVKRGNHHERLIEFLNEFDDVSITCIE